jgi:hypothetical protein
VKMKRVGISKKTELHASACMKQRGARELLITNV